VERQGAVVKGVIPKDKLYEFMELTRSSGLPLRECSLKKTSLEDKFFNIVKGEKQTAMARQPEQPE
jgi:hypothetical protein